MDVISYLPVIGSAKGVCTLLTIGTEIEPAKKLKEGFYGNLTTIVAAVSLAALNVFSWSAALHVGLFCGPQAIAHAYCLRKI